MPEDDTPNVDENPWLATVGTDALVVEIMRRCTSSVVMLCMSDYGGDNSQRFVRTFHGEASVNVLMMELTREDILRELRLTSVNTGKWIGQKGRPDIDGLLGGDVDDPDFDVEDDDDA